MAPLAPLQTPRQPDELDWAILGSWMAQISRDNDNCNVKILTVRNEPLCGLHMDAERPTLEFTLADRFFNPYAEH